MYKSILRKNQQIINVWLKCKGHNDIVLDQEELDLRESK